MGYIVGMVNRSPIRSLDDLIAQVTPTPNGCWPSPGAIDRHGYGRVYFNGRTTSTHRFAYEQTYGPVPEGLDLDHLCRNRWCCNPEHVEPVTRAVNLKRGAESRGAPPTCKHGHDMTNPDNVDPPSGGRRGRCKPCRLDRQRRYDARRRDALARRERVGTL